MARAANFIECTKSRWAMLSRPGPCLPALPEDSMLQFPRRMLFASLVFVLPAIAAAQSYDSTAFSALRWREIGPYRGGRSVAVAGSAKRPYEYWMGTTGSGVFKTVDGGMSWQPATDNYFGGTVGAIAVAESNPDIVWVAGGEGDIRGNTAPGDGVWMTKDAGKTWTRDKFFDVKNHARRLIIHPTNPDVIWIGVLGHAFGPNEQRGVFKTTDGGKSWRKVLYRDERTGISDMAIDPNNPNVLYAAFWHAYRTPWSMNSGGPGGGIFKSTDGGETWTELTNNPGLPKGLLGKIGLTVSGGKSGRVWAIIEHDEGGVYRSDDAGATWTKLNDERKLRQRAWYYSRIVADPKDSNVVYALNVQWFRSRDGGKTFAQGIQVPHGDNHDLWIAPNDPNRMVQANDGGANVSFNGGRAWTNQAYATAQMYHVTTTNHFPYQVCGAQQDNSTLCGPSRQEGGMTIADFKDAGGGESGYIASNPAKPDIVYAGSYGGLLTRKDLSTGMERNVSPWPDNPMGYSSEDIQYRFQWTFPIMFSPHNPNVLYAAGSQLFKTTTEGESWTIISPPLARRDPKTMGASGGPITKDQTGVETYGVIFALSESPITPGLIWAGTDDGLIWITRNGGVNWTNVTPKDIGDFTRVSLIDAGHFNAGTAYVAANRYQQDDFSPILYKTSDYGKTWTKIVNGIPAEEFTRAIREDPKKPGLLFASTEKGVWVSFDDGGHWQSLRRNLPTVPVHDLVIKDNDLVLGTHGRSFWIMDDIAPLRQLATTVTAKAAHLYKPSDAYRIDWGGGFRIPGAGYGGETPTGQNPPSGAVIYYNLKDANTRVTLEFLDAKGNLIKSFTSDSVATPAASPGGEGGRGGAPRPQRAPNRVGLNQFNWNLRYPDATRFDGMIFWAGNVTGPLALPGTYTVKLTANGEAQSQTFTVKADPRWKVSTEDLVAQFNFLIQIRDKVSEANEAVIAARDVKAQVDDRLKQAPQLGDQGKALNGKVTEVEGEIYQIKNQSSQDPLNFPIKLNNKIAALLGMVGSSPGRPPVQAVQVFKELNGKLDVQTKRMDKVYSEDLKAFNEQLKKLGLPEVTPKKKAPKVAAD
ncbi:MAG: glycosyl hydrolase [Gemmatimonadaceae bacterium]|nr:glycosyl hydrolase [Gemmatimonadaceae bacterium]